MKISEKRKAGSILERGGIAERIINLANDISQGSYKNAISKAGQIHELVEAATYDCYWGEKALNGKLREQAIMEDLIGGHITRDNVVCQVCPYRNIKVNG